MVSKAECLDILQLLGELEGWALSVGEPLPKVLTEKLAESIGMLRAEILGERD